MMLLQRLALALLRVRVGVRVLLLLQRLAQARLLMRVRVLRVLVPQLSFIQGQMQ